MKGGVSNITNLVILSFTIFFVANIPEVILARRIGLFPYQFYVAAIVIFSSLVVFSGVFLKIPQRTLYVIGWFVLLTVSCLLSLLVVSGDAVALNSVKNICSFTLISITFSWCLVDAKRIHIGCVGVLIAVILSVVATFIEFFNADVKFLADVMWETGIKEGVAQRVTGLHGNANANAYAMALGLFIGQLVLPKSVRFLFTLIVGLAVVTTASRSGMTLWVFVFLASAFIGLYGKGFSILRLSSLLFVLLLVVLLVSGQLPAIIEGLGLSEYMPKDALDRFSSGFISQSDGSAQARLGVAAFLFEQFTNNPIFGVGLGQSGGEVSEFGLASHNMALRMASEMGIIGLLVYTSLLLVPIFTKNPFGFIFVSLYFFMNMFTNTSIDKPIFAILIPLACLYLSEKQTKRKRKRRRAKHSDGRRSYEHKGVAVNSR